MDDGKVGKIAALVLHQCPEHRGRRQVQASSGDHLVERRGQPIPSTLGAFDDSRVSDYLITPGGCPADRAFPLSNHATIPSTAYDPSRRAPGFAREREESPRIPSLSEACKRQTIEMTAGKGILRASQESSAPRRRAVARDRVRRVCRCVAA